MDNEKLNAAFDVVDDELQALRIGLKILTAALSKTLPDGELAAAFENAFGELRNHPEAPKRAVEYLAEMAEAARKAVTPE